MEKKIAFPSDVLCCTGYSVNGMMAQDLNFSFVFGGVGVGAN